MEKCLQRDSLFTLVIHNLTALQQTVYYATTFAMHCAPWTNCESVTAFKAHSFGILKCAALERKENDVRLKLNWLPHDILFLMYIC